VGELVSFSLKVQHRLLKLRFGEQGGGNRRPLQMTFGLGFPMLEKLR
jgi:hypothetical protein